MARARRLALVRKQGAVEQIRYRKADDGRDYYHDAESPTDLYLATLGRKKVSVLVPRGDVDGWEQRGATTWLTNPPGAPTMSKRSSKKSKRRPPKGFRTWSAYMASIRPNGRKRKKRARARAARRASPSTPNGGSSMARRKTRRRKSAARRRSVVVYRNRPVAKRRRARTRYHRNPGGVFGNAIALGVGGAVGGAAMLAGEMAARTVRGTLFGKPAGTIAGAGIETLTGVVLGAGVEMVWRGEMGRQVARDVVAGVMASQYRTLLKQLNVPAINNALSDGGIRIIRPLAPNGRRRGINGYVRQGINGYVEPGLNGVNERIEQQLGYRA